MDYVLYLVVFLGSMLGAFLGAWFAVSMAERYYTRMSENKLHDTVFAPDPLAGGGTPEPAGDRLVSEEELATLTGECDTPERGATPFRNSGRGRQVEDVGWPDDMEDTAHAPVAPPTGNRRGLSWPPKAPAKSEQPQHGWSDNNAAGIYNDKSRGKDPEVKPLPGDLGTRR